ncbi:MAG: hypothetical protein ACRYG8_16120, partial [Janthinobacterium lividum]
GIETQRLKATLAVLVIDGGSGQTPGVEAQRLGREMVSGASLLPGPNRTAQPSNGSWGRKRLCCISRCGDELARTALYEAAHSLLIRRSKWSALRAWGMGIAKRRGMARARVAVARKLAVVLHRMWADGSEFRWSKQAASPIA